jgi:hypothetical protein
MGNHISNINHDLRQAWLIANKPVHSFFLYELCHLLCVLLRGGVVIVSHCGADDFSIFIDYHKAINALVVLDAPNTFFYLCHFFKLI